MFNKLFKVLLLSLVLFTASCTHRKVTVTRVSDSSMTCSEIKEETAQMELFLKDVDEKTGISGRNVGMALLFWPGIIVNEINASDATKLANDRLTVLARLYGKKQCDNPDQVNVEKTQLEDKKVVS